MAQWKVRINRTEVYEMDVVVEAKDLDEAIGKVQEEWINDDYLYDQLSNCMVDSDTNYWKLGAAGNNDANLIHLD